FELYIRKGMDNTTGAIVTQAMNGPGLTSQTAYIDVAANGTGVYTIHVVPDTTPVVTDKYHGNARAVPITPAPPPPAPQDTGLKIGYENFEVPGVLTPVTVTTGPTVEDMRRGAGEPAIRSNWAPELTHCHPDMHTRLVPARTF